MGLFSKFPSLEERVTTAESGLAEFAANLERVTGELTAANEMLAVLQLQLQLTEATAAAESATARATEAETNFAAADQWITDLRSSIQRALQIDDTQLATLVTVDLAVIATAVTHLAGRQAVPPVVTSSTLPGASEDDAIAAIREQAASGREPQKRAALHAKATNLQNQKLRVQKTERNFSPEIDKLVRLLRAKADGTDLVLRITTVGASAINPGLVVGCKSQV